MRITGNQDIAVGVDDLEKAVDFYEGTLGFILKKEQNKLRVYDTGHFTLYVQEGNVHPPIPSYTVDIFDEARRHLIRNGCSILEEREKSLYFSDPFGLVWDIIEQNPEINLNDRLLLPKQYKM